MLRTTWILKALMFSGLLLTPVIVRACTVIETDFKLSLEETRRYYRENFKGAIFTGKVLSLRETDLELVDGLERVMRVEVEVESLLIGEEDKKIVVFTGRSEGDCHMPFDVGKVYGFQATLENGSLRSTFLNTTELKSSEDAERWVKKLKIIFGSQ